MAVGRKIRAVAAAAVAATVVALGVEGPAAVAAEPVGAAAASAAPTGILAAPTQVAHTRLGDVGYREVGHGPAIVLIMGHGASMDNWTPGFVDTLAQHHRVVVFDNAGIGLTSPLPGTLTVPAMADQTAALLQTLHLHRPAVLGWSMGGMIAQALAVRHPERVGALVLAATQAGNGRALPIPAAALAKLNNPNPMVGLSAIFPSDQMPALLAYVQGIESYPGFYHASPQVRDAQSAAIDAWIAGQDRTGHHLGSIHVPVLVADGAEDEVDPAPNASILASSVRHARVTLYPDAGHAFLFQDAPQFLAQTERFLAQAERFLR